METIQRIKSNLTCEFNARNKPIAKLFVGDEITVETINAWGLVGDTFPQEKIMDTPNSAICPCTGPIYIEDTMPGDTLVIEIKDIRVAGKGFVPFFKGAGILHNYVDAPYVKTYQIEKNMIIINDDFTVPVKPVIGTFGTTPRWPVPTVMPGFHGGNLDDTNAAIGNKFHMPVHVNGALFQLGDVHAAQADAEIFCGVECDAEVDIKIVELKESVFFPVPIIETPTHWSIPAQAATLPEAIEMATKFATDFIMDRTGCDRKEACFLMCAAGNIRLSQAAVSGMNVTVRAEVPKDADLKNRLN